MPGLVTAEPVLEGRTGGCCLTAGLLPMLVPTSDQVLDVQDGGS